MPLQMHFLGWKEMLKIATKNLYSRQGQISKLDQFP